jgi:hypothetical protein
MKSKFIKINSNKVIIYLIILTCLKSLLGPKFSKKKIKFICDKIPKCHDDSK